jgi:hypothetical protein
MGFFRVVGKRSGGGRIAPRAIRADAEKASAAHIIIQMVTIA